MPVTHCIPVPQPWAWALVNGHVECVNGWLPPRPELIGQRVAILSRPLDGFGLYLLGLNGINVPKPPERAKALTEGKLVGTAELQGWIGVAHGGKAAKQVRPGNVTLFRKPKGMAGPICWVMRKAKASAGNPEGLKVLKIGYWDHPTHQAQLLSYAAQYGVGDLSIEHARLVELLKAKNERQGKR